MRVQCKDSPLHFTCHMLWSTGGALYTVVSLGAKSRIVIIKVARRANTFPEALCDNFNAVAMGRSDHTSLQATGLQSQDSAFPLTQLITFCCLISKEQPLHNEREEQPKPGHLSV